MDANSCWDRPVFRALVWLGGGMLTVTACIVAILYPRHAEQVEPKRLSAASEPAAPPGPTPLENEDPGFAQRRGRMVERELAGRDITNRKVLDVMGRVPRQRFVPDEFQDEAYADRPLPIGRGQTISQPYIVALMTQIVEPTSGDRALDIGTGSGYQAAVLAEICKEVYSIEIVESLAKQARTRLAGLGYKNVVVRQGDGYQGWKEKGPFDVIIVAAAPEHVPQPLVDQLAPGGRMVIPVGRSWQRLLVISKDQDGAVDRRVVADVRFVPMTGEAERPER